MLLTGFQSFGARAINPAEEIVKRLDGQAIGGERIDGRVLPVDYAKLEPSVREAIEQTRPNAIIYLGLWFGVPMIRLERFAVNVADFEIADNAGAMIKAPINADGEAAYLGSLPLDAIGRTPSSGWKGSAGRSRCHLPTRPCDLRHARPHPCA